MTNRGSITVETLLILPFFLLMVVTMLLLFGALHREAMLQEAVNETVKLVASSSVLVTALPSIPQLPPEWEALRSLIPDAVVDTFLSQVHQKTTPLHAYWVVPLVHAHVDEPKQHIVSEQIRLEELVMPTGTERFFGIKATYTWHVPIIRRSLVIRAAAIERCWVGS